MIAKRRAIGTNNDWRKELRSVLADMLTLRNQGLLNQREFDEKLDEVANSIPRVRVLEYNLPGGKTRFVLRSGNLGRVVFHFELYCGHPVQTCRT
jgi:hypothetical protein